MKKIISILIIAIIFGAGYYLLSRKTSLKTSIKNISSNESKDETPPINTDRMTIPYLRKLSFIDAKPLNIEIELGSKGSYSEFLTSYRSEGLKIYALLAVPNNTPPAKGFPAVILNHGYIPPKSYSTTERYQSFVNGLARKGFVVLKPDFRGHGQSEGEPSGAYFSSDYVIDILNAFEALRQYSSVNPDAIGMWGHSMSGNLTLRAMVVQPKIKAGAIWAGAVYSYKDFIKYGLSDASYHRNPRPSTSPHPTYGFIRQSSPDPEKVVTIFKNVAPINFLSELKSPLQIHHGEADSVVSINYSKDLVAELEKHNNIYEFYTYSLGDHNLSRNSFSIAIERTADFFAKYLK